MLYSELKDFGVNKLGAGFLAGAIATASTHPFELIRARLQTIGLTEKHQVSDHLIWK
jgi:hypothetical protein